MAIIRLPGPVEITDEIDRSDLVARIAIDRMRIQNPRRLICSVWVGRPQVRQRCIFACECEVDQFDDELVLRLVLGVFLAYRLVAGEGFERQLLDDHGEEVALILRAGSVEKRRNEEDDAPQHDCRMHDSERNRPRQEGLKEKINR